MDDAVKSVLLGALGGAAGTLAMRLYWSAATALAGEDPRARTLEGPPHALDEVGVAGQQYEAEEGSTAAAGRIAYEAATGEEPGAEAKTQLSYGIHWGYGLAMGSLYGLVRGRADGLDAGGGLAFGAALWLLGDELMVPLLGLSAGPTAYPPSQHAHRLGAHAVYGLTMAATTQVLHTTTTPRRTASGLAWRGLKMYTKWKAVRAAGHALRGFFR